MSRTLHQDAQALRNYVTAVDGHQYDLLPEGMVAVTVSHSNLQAKHIDIRLDLHLTVEQVKEKLFTHCGTSVSHQRLYRIEDERLLYELENHRMLGYYGIESGMTLHIVDTDPFSMSRNGGLEDVALIQKYSMSEEDYDQRKGTLRSWIREKRAADPNFKLKPKSGPGSACDTASDTSAAPPGPETVEHVEVGARCEVMPGSRRGTVAFVGEVPGLTSGWWVGVRLDEPLGKSSGAIKGVEYFDCPPNYGAFVRGPNVLVGDFPADDLGLDDDDDDEGDLGSREKKSTDAGAATTMTSATENTTHLPQVEQLSIADKVLSGTTKAMLARARLGSDDINDDDEDEI